MSRHFGHFQKACELVMSFMQLHTLTGVRKDKAVKIIVTILVRNCFYVVNLCIVNSNAKREHVLLLTSHGRFVSEIVEGALKNHHRKKPLLKLAKHFLELRDGNLRHQTYDTIVIPLVFLNFVMRFFQY